MDPARKIRYQPPHEAQGPTIRTARTSRGITQQELGRRVGLIVGVRRGHRVDYTQQYISRLEQNLCCAAGRTAAALEQVLGVSVPLPRMLPEQHALGREAIREARRQVWEAKEKERTVPRLVQYYPEHLIRWG